MIRDKVSHTETFPRALQQIETTANDNLGL